MKRSARRKRRVGQARLGRRGTAAIEFALVSVPLLILLIGTAELGMVFADQYALSLGVERAARFAIVHSLNSAAPASTAEITAVFQQAANPLIGSSASGAQVTVSFDPSDTPGSVVTVSAQYPFTPITGIVPIPPLTLSAQASYVIQN
jgi:Flp pilus assembly protein TadG